MARQSIIKYLFEAMFFGNCFEIGKQQFNMYLIDGLFWFCYLWNVISIQSCI